MTPETARERVQEIINKAEETLKAGRKKFEQRKGKVPAMYKKVADQSEGFDSYARRDCCRHQGQAGNF